MKRELVQRSYAGKPLTKKMIAHLQRARTIELSHVERNICSINDFNDTLPGLHSRGLIDIKMVLFDDKEVLAVYITKSGINFLNEYKEERKNSKQIQWLAFKHYFLRLT
jgi:hypothetical protein